MLRLIRDTGRELGRRLGITLLFMVAMTLVMTPIALVAPLWVRLLTAAFLWLGGSAYAVGRFDDDLDGWAIVLVAVPVFMVAFGLRDYVDVASGQHVAGIPASRVLEYPHAQGFDFTDAVIQDDFSLTHRVVSRDRKSGRETSSYYTVAPLTDADWTYKDPVPAWVGCNSNYVDTNCQWDEPATGAIAAPQFYYHHLRDAADQARDSFNLTEAPGAPLLERADSADAGVNRRLLQLVAAPILSYFIWAVPVTCIVLWGLLVELVRWR